MQSISRSNNFKIASVNMIELAFAIDSLVGKGCYVDSYFGDYKVDETKLLGNYEDIQISLNKILKTVKELKDDPKNEVRDLLSIVESMSAFVSHKLGEFHGYNELIKTLYHVELELVDEESISSLKSEAHILLKKKGYGGKWESAVEDWRNDSRVESSEYIDILREELSRLKELSFRDVAPSVMGTPFDEKLLNKSIVDIKVVDTDESWDAYHYYQGNFSSTIEINSNQTFNKHSAFIFAAHEAYPGHHFEAFIKEYLYKRGELPLASTITILNTCACLVSEGIGDYGSNFIPYDVTVDKKIAFILDRLRMESRHNFAVKLMRNEISRDEAIKGLSIEALISEEDAEKAIGFAEKWKYYFPIYALGYKNVKILYEKYKNKSLPNIYKYGFIA